MGIGTYCLGGGILGADVHWAVYGIGTKLIPEAADARSRAIGIEKRGVSEVEPYIHNAQHHPIAGISLWQTCACVDVGGIGIESHRVELQSVAAFCLNTVDTCVGYNTRQGRHRYICHKDVANLRYRHTPIVAERLGRGIGSLDKGAHTAWLTCPLWSKTLVGMGINHLPQRRR